MMSLAKLFDLKGKVALVTGGSRGLGLQMAEALGELGAKVAITARKHDELDEAAKHLRSLGIEALPVVCDMGDLRAIAPLVDTVLDKLGPIDVLVNNAGTSWGAPTVEHPLDAWNKVMTLNVTALFVLTQEVGAAAWCRERAARSSTLRRSRASPGPTPRACRRSPTTRARARSST
jgi:gluconate 5-dehydrogenase